ncbi:hypothetical protein [Pseudoxanthomonas suwonensis]|jgi:hypothetical protein|uniref:hypothetical protein n=1 Tax=Pseudoxanthomonas suwonensis TaxID=314722 RepID=UPI00138F2782|nr:hypothetical protein [Pseudoxanthomonas suwonensis]KAF1701250.1 hypothetical protein CSC68_09220 [Pseudoxanthomonas suwonensis]
MIRRTRSASRVLSVALVLGLGVLALPQAQAGEVDCKLRFNLEGWSVFYKTATGTGTITCDNGASRAVKITAKGGGLTFGKSKIENGVGEFSGVNSIADTLGTYATAEVHAGAAKSSKAQVMTKGEVSLALAGTGKGWDLGVAFGKFVIE